MPPMDKKPIRPTRIFSFEVDAVSYAIYEKWIDGHKCKFKKPHIMITITGTQYGKYIEARCKCGQYVDLSPWGNKTEVNPHYIAGKENKKK
jgi:hypothetical protein